MNTLTVTPAAHTADYLYNNYVLQSNMQQLEQAATWYHEAQEIAHDIAQWMNAPLEVGACVISAFSPRERWATNVAKAYAFANGQTVRGLSNNLKMAEAVIDAANAGASPFDALKGQKTNAFARAIAGDTDAVVIDTWMLKAAGMDSSKGVNKSDYNMLADTVRNIASEHGLTPRTAQALIWIVKRGSHA